MRAIAEEAFAMVRDYKGSHSGEHGDGISRSEFHESMFGTRMVQAFEEVKQRFDPDGLLNPGRVVDPPKMDDRSLFRYPPDYRASRISSRRSTGLLGREGAPVSRAPSRCATITVLAESSMAA